MIANQKDLALQIAAFLNKHGNHRTLLPTGDYEFEIDGINSVSIPDSSINVLPTGAVQFHGDADVNQHDTASKVFTKQKVSFHGTAFFATDIQGDDCLLKVSLDQIKPA